MTVIERLEAIETPLSVKQLSNLLGVPAKSIYKAIANGRLAAYRLGGVRIDPADVVEWLRERRTK